MRKKILTIIIAMIGLLIIIIGLTGCDLGDTEKTNTTKDVENTLNIGDKLVNNQATPTDIDYSLERYNLIKRAYWVNGMRDKARASIASYKSDKTTYEMYRDSDNTEKQSWAEQAKMRANKTANVYNEYMLKNSYVFDGNIPSDIYYQLELIY